MADAEQILRQCLEKSLDVLGYKERDIEIKVFDSGASNFTTMLFEVTVTSSSKETLDLFAKTAIMGKAIREQFNAGLLYDTEYNFYTKLVQGFHGLYNKYNVPDEDRLIFPKFYGGTLERGAEVLILENLKKNKYALFDRKKSVDWEHAAISIKNLAKYHALGFALKKENPELFAEFDKPSYTQEEMEKMAPKAQIMMAEAMKLVQEEYRSKVGAILADTDLMMKSMNGSLGSGYNTLIHADYRTSNIMYKRQKGKLISVPVDYQTIRLGNVFQDIMYFIWINTDEQFRKYYWKQLIDFYYTELTTSLRNLNLDVTEILPRESYDEDLKTFLPTMIMMVLMLVPLVVVETSVAPDMSAEGAEIEDFLVPANEISETRIKGVMRDFARMGVF